MKKTSIPYYYKVVDHENLVKQFAPPDEWYETVYKWPKDKVRKLQNERFLEVVRRGWEFPFYKRRWTEAGLRPGDIKSLDDINKIPTFSVQDLVESVQSHPPFGDFQMPIERGREMPIRIVTSGGTTGKPRPTMHGARDWELQALIGARMLYMQGAQAGEVIQIPMNCAMPNGGWAYSMATLYWLCSTPLTTGTGATTGSQRQLEFAKDFGTTIWVIFADYALKLVKEAEKMGLDLKKDFKTRFLSSFLGPDVNNELRKTLEDAWGCDVYDNYGTNEMGGGAAECREKDGLHVLEDTFYMQAVDFETEEPVGIGQEGNLVGTSLCCQWPPFIRYNYRDVVKIKDETRCGCGSSFKRMDKWMGRTDDMVKIKGTNIFPAACGDVVREQAGTTGEWVFVVDEKGEGLNREITLAVKVEYKDDSVNKETLKHELAEKLHKVLGVKVDIDPVPPESLAEYVTASGRREKSTRFMDLRKTKF